MAQAARLNLRMQKELKLLLSDPPYGASFPFLSVDSDHLSTSLSAIDAQIEGPEGTVYENGYFHIKIQIPERYPFQPPIVMFATPIYHPNIDTGGRICLDILNLPPKGAWQPSLNISTVLTSIGLLLSEPNPDDGLMCEASREYKYNRQAFNQKARSMTEKYAKALTIGSSSSSDCFIITPNKNLEGEKALKEEISCDKLKLKQHGISGKLSLQSSGAAGELNDIRPAFQPTSAPRGEETDMDMCTMESKYDPRQTNEVDVKLSGMRRKLSLQASLQSRKNSNESSTPSEVQLLSSSIFKTNQDMIQSQDGNSLCQGARSNIMTNSPVSINPLAEPFNQTKGVAPYSCQTQQAQSSSASFCPTTTKLSMKKTPPVESKALPENRDKGSNDSATKGYKQAVSSKKLSLGHKKSAETVSMDNKENIPVSIKEPKCLSSQLSSGSSPLDVSYLNGRPPNSNISANNQNQGLHKKLSLQPLKKLQASRDYNEAAAYPPNTTSGSSIRQPITVVEPPTANEVIVKDSDESGDEKSQPPRKKLILAGKRLSLAGKRRPKA